ncbi:hypothetical protein [Actibacterium sp. D379-3]
MQNPTNSDDPPEADKRRFLSDPAAYAHRPDRVDVVETHMSWIFLAGNRVFKLKKPVRYPFLDFSTLALRERAVRDELRLNRRLAPDVYLGAHPLRISPQGALTLHGEGRIVDWLVEMGRLPEDRTLAALIRDGTVQARDIDQVAELLARFYRAQPPAGIAPTDYAARFAAEHEKTATTLSDPALQLDGPRVAAMLRCFEQGFDAIRPLLEQRVRNGHVVEGHGDLRPEHVFLTDPPVIIDCLEFNFGLRSVDPFDEAVFLGLECASLGAAWVFPILHRRLTDALNDHPPPELLAFYWRYRALLRARLALLHLSEHEVRTPEKWRPMAWRYVALAEQATLRTRPE